MQSEMEDGCAFELVFGKSVAILSSQLGFMNKCSFSEILQKKMMTEMGWFLSEIKISETLDIDDFTCQVKVGGKVEAETKIFRDLCLAMNQRPIDEKIIEFNAGEMFAGFACSWIEKLRIYHAVKSGSMILSAADVLVNWIMNFIYTNSSELFGHKELEKLINHSEWHSDAVKESLSKTQETVILQTFRNLLSEGIALKPLETIFALISIYGGKDCDSSFLTKTTREELAKEFSGQYVNRGEYISCISIAPSVEDWLAKHIKQASELDIDHLSKKMLQLSILSTLKKAAAKGYRPAILTSETVRTAIKELTKELMPELLVISASEIPPDFNVVGAGCIGARDIYQVLPPWWKDRHGST